MAQAQVARPWLRGMFPGGQPNLDPQGNAPGFTASVRLSPALTAAWRACGTPPGPLRAHESPRAVTGVLMIATRTDSLLMRLSALRAGRRYPVNWRKTPAQISHPGHALSRFSA